MIKTKVEEIIWRIKYFQLTNKAYRMLNGGDARGFAIAIIPIFIQTIANILLLVFSTL